MQSEWWKNDCKKQSRFDHSGSCKFQAQSYALNDEALQLYEKLVKSYGHAEALVGLLMTYVCTDFEMVELYD